MAPAPTTRAGYTQDMKRIPAACLATLIACSSARAQSYLMPTEAPETPRAAGAADPAYRMVEGVSDGVYDFMRIHILGNILPERLTRSLKAAPDQDSAPLFDRNLREAESRYLARARAAYPIYSADKPPTDAQIQAWRSWATAEQMSVGVGALGDTLIERYKLELFGGASGSYALDRRNWDPGFLTMAGVLGGTFLYLNGVHATMNVAGFKLGVDVAPGLRLRQAMHSQGEFNRLASLELGYKKLPVSVTTEWGSSNGKARGERYGLVYRLRY